MADTSFASTRPFGLAASATGIVKQFDGRRVLDNVGIRIESGRIHALLGANGSGKSTLVKILTGVYQPDAGRIAIGERDLAKIGSPVEANALGIAVVHQETPLIDSFSIAECIAQFRGYPTAGGRIQWKKLYRDVEAKLAAIGLNVSPHQRAGRLTASERALVAIMIALEKVSEGIRLLVLDEVTASLPRHQAEPYLDRVLNLARSGIGVLMVTHRLAELHGRGSDVTVLRDGKVVMSREAEGLGDAEIVASMVGKDAAQTVASGPAGKGRLVDLWRARGGAMRQIDRQTPAATMDGVAGVHLTDLNLRIMPGEIVGMVGLIEAGIGEVPRILAGLLRPAAGTVEVGGSPIGSFTPGELIHAGACVLPADRHQSGGIRSLSVDENIVLPDVGRYWHHKPRRRAVLARLVEYFDIRPPNPRTMFGTLSGGNQQKTILGKWLLMRPALLVLDDPTNGVDPNARATIFELLAEAAAEGIGILAFSTEPEQFAGLCSRVLVLREGKIAKELVGEEITRSSISQWAYG